MSGQLSPISPTASSSQALLQAHRPPPSPTRTSTIHDTSKLAPELDKQYLTSEEYAFASGAYSDVFEGRWECPHDSRYPNGVDVAIKVFRLGGAVNDPIFKTNNDRCGKHLGREVLVWQKFDHPRITPFVGYIRGYKDNIVPCIVSPKRPSNLDVHLHNNPKADRIELMCQILEGLIYLHNFRPGPIVHFDIKPGNILITEEGTAELSDFGCAKALDGITTGFTTGNSPGGSYPYMAPEVLLESTEFEHLTPAADMYAIGSLALFVLSGKNPWYNTKSKGAFMLEVMNGTVPTRAQHPMSGTPEALNRLWELLNSCWSLDPTTRPSAQEFLDELREIKELGGVRPMRS